MSSGCDTPPELPAELIIKILLNFSDASDDLIDLLNCQLVSKRFSALAKSPAIWSALLKNGWRNSDATTVRDSATPFCEYKHFIHRFRLDSTIREQIRTLVRAKSDRIPLVQTITSHGYDAVDALERIYLERHTLDKDGERAYTNWLQTDNGQDWIASEYWAEVCIDIIHRKAAFEVFRSRVWGWDSRDRPQRTVDDLMDAPSQSKLDAKLERSLFAAFDAFWSGEPLESERTLSNIRLLGDERLLPGTPHQDLVKRTWRYMGSVGLRKKKNRLDSLFLTCLLDGINSYTGKQEYECMGDNDAESDSDSETQDFENFGIRGEDLSPSAQSIPHAIIFCAMLRNLASGHDIQAWPACNLPVPAIAVAKASDQPGRERWAFFTLRDELWHPSADALKEYFRARHMDTSRIDHHKLSDHLLPCPTSDPLGPCPTSVTFLTFAEYLLGVATETRHPSVLFAAHLALMAGELGRSSPSFLSNLPTALCLDVFENDIGLRLRLARGITCDTTGGERCVAAVKDYIKAQEALDEPVKAEDVKHWPAGQVKLGATFVGIFDETHERRAMLVTAWNPSEIVRIWEAGGVGEHYVHGGYLCMDELGFPWVVSREDMTKWLNEGRTPSRTRLREFEETMFVKKTFRSRIGHRFLPQAWVAAMYPEQ